MKNPMINLPSLNISSVLDTSTKNFFGIHNRDWEIILDLGSDQFLLGDDIPTYEK